MTKFGAGLLRMIATKSVIAATPVAMASAFASSLVFPPPPRMAAHAVEQIAEISVSPTTVGIAASTLYGQTKAQIDAQLDEMQALGVETIRVFIPWALIEFNPVSPQTAVAASVTPIAVDDAVHVAFNAAKGCDVVPAADEAGAPVAGENVTPAAEVVEIAKAPVPDEPLAEVPDPVAEPVVATAGESGPAESRPRQAGAVVDQTAAETRGSHRTA